MRSYYGRKCRKTILNNSRLDVDVLQNLKQLKEKYLNIFNSLIRMGLPVLDKSLLKSNFESQNGLHIFQISKLISIKLEGSPKFYHKVKLAHISKKYIESISKTTKFEFEEYFGLVNSLITLQTYNYSYQTDILREQNYNEPTEFNLVEFIKLLQIQNRNALIQKFKSTSVHGYYELKDIKIISYYYGQEKEYQQTRELRQYIVKIIQALARILNSIEIENLSEVDESILDYLELKKQEIPLTQIIQQDTTFDYIEIPSSKSISKSSPKSNKSISSKKSNKSRSSKKSNKSISSKKSKSSKNVTFQENIKNSEGVSSVPSKSNQTSTNKFQSIQEEIIEQNQQIQQQINENCQQQQLQSQQQMCIEEQKQSDIKRKTIIKRGRQSKIDQIFNRQTQISQIWDIVKQTQFEQIFYNLNLPIELKEIQQSKPNKIFQESKKRARLLLNNKRIVTYEIHDSLKYLDKKIIKLQKINGRKPFFKYSFINYELDSEEEQAEESGESIISEQRSFEGSPTSSMQEFLEIDYKVFTHSINNTPLAMIQDIFNKDVFKDYKAIMLISDTKPQLEFSSKKKYQTKQSLIQENPFLPTQISLFEIESNYYINLTQDD